MKLIISMLFLGALTTANARVNNGQVYAKLNRCSLSCSTHCYNFTANISEKMATFTANCGVSNPDTDYSNCMDAAADADFWKTDAKKICNEAKPGTAKCIMAAFNADMWKTDIMKVCENATLATSSCIVTLKKMDAYKHEMIKYCPKANVNTVNCMKENSDSGRKVINICFK